MRKKTLTVTFLIIFLVASWVPASLQLLADASMSARGAIIAPAPPQDGTPTPPPPPTEYTLIIQTTEGGTTSPSPGAYTHEENISTSITAVPDSGYDFYHWVVDGYTKTSNPVYVMMVEDVTATAYFVQQQPPPPPTPQDWNPPSAPPSQGTYNAWHTGPEHDSRMKSLCDSHSRADYVSIGTRSDGSTIWMYRIGNPNGGCVMWDGKLHGIEDYGAEICWLIALWILESGETRANAILQENYALFVPVVNNVYTRENLNGVNLNRNFETGWRASAENPGPYAASELETQALKTVFSTYRPEHYVNLHQWAEWAGYYSGCPSSEAQAVVAKINQVAGEFGITPWSMRPMGSTGYAMGDAYHDGGAISWLIEVSDSWRHDEAAWNNELIPAFWKCLVHFVAQCEECQSENGQPPPPSPAEYWSVTISSQPLVGGTTTPSGSVEVEVGDTLTVQANAGPDYTFERWLFNDASFSNYNPVTIPTQVADSTHTLEAVFAEIPEPEPEPPEPPPPEPEPPEPEPEPGSIRITVDTNEIVATNRLEAGIYIGSPDTGEFKNDAAFRQIAEDANVKYVAFMENRLWAVPHPCTSFPNSWNWQGMDDLIQKIFDMEAEPIIVLGFWLSDGVWTVDGYRSPTPEEWGAYCAEWVKHFKAVGLPVKYYDIGHETHQYTSSLSRLRYCIDLYVEAEKQMRAANPNILLATDNNMDIGNSWQVGNIQQEYLDKGATFDFLMWHRYVTGSMSTSTAKMIEDSEFHEGGVMGPANWIDPARQHYYNEKGVWLPVIAAGNLNWAYSGGTDPRLQDIVGGVCMALNFKLMMLKGVDSNIVYIFGGSGSSNFGVVNLNTHELYYPGYVYKMLGPNLAKGDVIVDSSSSSSNIATVAWIHRGTLNILLVHKTTGSESLSLAGVSGTFTYQRLDSTHKPPQTGSVGAGSSITLNGYTVMLLQTEASP